VKGFTLIEIIVVIGLIGLLAVALLPQIVGGQEAAKINQCRTLIAAIGQQIDAYESQRNIGDFPPDDFVDPQGKVKIATKNAINLGIESLVAFLHRKDSRERGLLDMNAQGELYANTDRDTTSSSLGKLDTHELKEVVDPWGNPLAYFHYRSYRKKINVTYEMGGDMGEQQQVSPWIGEGGAPLAPARYQLFSAGPDQVFKTADDIGNFETPQDL